MQSTILLYDRAEAPVLTLQFLFLYFNGCSLTANLRALSSCYALSSFLTGCNITLTSYHFSSVWFYLENHVLCQLSDEISGKRGAISIRPHSLLSVMYHYYKIRTVSYNRGVVSVRPSLRFFSLRDNLDFDKIWYRHVHINRMPVPLYVFGQLTARERLGKTFVCV
jgi:hypothetical protein